MAESIGEGTGKGAARSSVLDHRFGAGPPLTVGIEEEYMLLEPGGFDLVSGVEELLAETAETEMADRLKPELMQCVLESGTCVCEDVPEAAAALRELVFGMHVHVAVPSPQACLAVMEGVLIELPVLLALSANSPFWRGDHTGLASSRAMIFSAFPRSGLPPRFADYQDYAEAVGFMEATGAIGDYTHLWWDVRPHPRFGTIEVRVMDCQTRLEDTIALAAYVQCLVKLLLDRYEQGQVLSYHRMLLSENKWLALRYGLDAPLMDLAAGKRVKMAARTLARRRIRELRPISRDLGCADELARIDWILEHGNGADRQRQVWNANRDIAEVAEEIAVAAERV